MKKIVLFILLSLSVAGFAQDNTQSKKSAAGLRPSSAPIINNPLWLVDHRTIIADSLVNNIDIGDSIAVVDHAKKLGIKNITGATIFTKENHPGIMAVYGTRAYKGVVLIFTEPTSPTE